MQSHHMAFEADNHVVAHCHIRPFVRPSQTDDFVSISHADHETYYAYDTRLPPPPDPRSTPFFAAITNPCDRRFYPR